MSTLSRIVREAYEHGILYLALCCFVIVGVLNTAVSTALYLILPRRAGIWFGRRTIGWVFRSYLAMLHASGVMRLDLAELDRVRNDRSVIIAPNHPCLLDAVLVISRMPDIGCIIKAQIWDSVVLGGGARLARYIRNDSSCNMIRQAIRELSLGHKLLVFPEGTRTRSHPINSFKGGFALIAKKSGAPVQTVFIETNSAFLSKGWPVVKKPEMPLTYRVRLGKRFYVSGNVKLFVRSLETYFRHELEARRIVQRAPAIGEHRITPLTPAQ